MHETIIRHDRNAGYGKMEPECKKLWVKALRSGEYRQTRGSLYAGSFDSYCALGVGFDSMFDDEDWVQELAPMGPYGIPTNLGCIWTNNSMLPIRIRIKCGLSTSAQRFIQVMNDHRGYTFNEIANWIQRVL